MVILWVKLVLVKIFQTNMTQHIVFNRISMLFENQLLYNFQQYSPIALFTRVFIIIFLPLTREL